MKEKNNKKENSNALNSIIFLVWATALSLIVGFFGQSIGDEISNMLFGNAPKVVSKTGLTEANRESHMKGCLGTGANEEYCSCTFEQTKDLYSAADLQQLAKEVKNGAPIPEGMINAMNTCAHLR